MKLGELIFLWAPPVLQFVLVLVFLGRGIFVSKFPAFFAYTCFAVVANIVPIAFLHNDVVLYWVYWGTQIIYGVLALLAMREVFSMVWDLKVGRRRSYVWMLLCIIVCTSLGWGVYHPSGVAAVFIVHTAFRTFITEVHLVEVFLCVVAMCFIGRLTRYHLGIMLGFATSASVQVLAYFARFFRLSPALDEIVTYAPLAAYLASTGIWLGIFLSKPESTLQLDHDAAAEWVRTQERIGKKISADLGLKWPDSGKNGDNSVKQSSVGPPEPSIVRASVTG